MDEIGLERIDGRGRLKALRGRGKLWAETRSNVRRNKSCDIICPPNSVYANPPTPIPEKTHRGQLRHGREVVLRQGDVRDGIDQVEHNAHIGGRGFFFTDWGSPPPPAPKDQPRPSLPHKAPNGTAQDLWGWFLFPLMQTPSAPVVKKEDGGAQLAQTLALYRPLPRV